MTETRTKKKDLFADIPDAGAADLFADIPAQGTDSLFGDIPEEKPLYERALEGVSDVASTYIETQKELGRILGGGVRDAAQNVVGLVAQPDTMGGYIAEKLGLTTRTEKGDEVILPQVQEPQSDLGRFAKKAVQFGVGFVPIAKTLEAAQVGSALTRAMASGAITDFSVFDPHEERLSNLVEEVPALQNPVTAYLASKPGDTEMEGRLKNALEGLGIGAAIDGVMYGIRAIKSVRDAKNMVNRTWDEAATAAENATEIKQTPIREDVPTPVERAIEEPLPEPTTVTPSTVKPSTMTPEEAIAPTAPDVQVRSGGREIHVAGNINLDRLDTPEDIKNLFINIAKEQGGFQGARKKGAELGAERTRAIRQANVASAARVNDSLQAAIGGSDADKLRFIADMEKHAAIQSMAAGRAAEASAALRAHKETIAAAGEMDFAKMREVIEKMGGNELVEDKALLLSRIDDLEALGNTAGKIWKAKTIDKAVEYWINGLLSGPATHMANLGSNLAVAAIGPVERFASGMFGVMSRNPDKVYIGEAAHMLGGQLNAMWKATKEAGLVAIGKEAAGIGKTELRHRKAIQGPLGPIIRTPTRLLSASDVWFKTINYGGELQAQAYRAAKAKGLKGEALANEMERLIESPTDAIHKRAWRKAEEATFTIPLKEQEGTMAELGKGAKYITDRAPVMKLVMPFVQTPVNIFKWSTSRSPAAFVLKDVRNELFSKSTSRARKQEILGQMALGSAISGTAVMMAQQGLITGGGPPDPNDRRIWRENNQPYSIKVDGKWHSFARFEPMGTLFGVAADMVEISDRVSQEGYETLAGNLFSAVVANTKDKTFLQGVSKLVEAVDPKMKGAGERYLGDLLATVVPNIAAQTARSIDPVMRDARNILDRLKARTPGMSFDVEPVQNIWGQDLRRESLALQPVYVHTDKNDKVSNEMVRLGVGPEMPARQIGGVELTPAQYTDYVKMAGQPAKEELDDLVSSSTWDRMQVWEQAEEIQTIIREWRSDARDMMFEKYPELEQAVFAKEEEKYAQ